MRDLLNNFLLSGHKFSELELDLQNRFQIVNIGLFLSGLGMIYGIIGNIIRDIKGFVLIESILLVMIVSIVFILRRYRGFFEYATLIMTGQFLLLFLYLLYVGDPSDLKHVWILTFPAILLYFQTSKKILFWLFLMLFFVVLAPIQTFVEVKYSLYQVTYLSFVLMIMSVMIHFYQTKMNQAQKLILEQQKQLLEYQYELKDQVLEKTTELRELNESLETKVKEKINELISKDKILTAQSKQAVMGEMISMIAHQWRQPLSTITLQISNLQIKKLLNKDISDEQFDNALTGISDTIVYLSDTVDDFQSFFRPDNNTTEVKVSELLQKAMTFSKARLQENSIDIVVRNEDDITLNTYVNEFVQVILNILNNAIDAYNENKIENPVIGISYRSDGEYVEVDIHDNAGGIKEINLPKLFEPYFSTKGKNGTGLGLYMCQMIVEKQLNGNINVRSNDGESTFTIKVPRNID